MRPRTCRGSCRLLSDIPQVNGSPPGQLAAGSDSATGDRSGWNPRHHQTGASGLLLNLTGAIVPFAAAKEEREARGDPHPSVADRYPNREVHSEQVR